MGTKKHERTHARRCAVQILYQSELLGKPLHALLEEDLCIEGELAPGPYALKLIGGVEENQEAIDSHLRDTSENWSVERMPIVDRAILRLSTFEMMYVDDVPLSVSINEAVELAKDFGGADDSPRFVNGVLGRIARLIEGEKVDE